MSKFDEVEKILEEVIDHVEWFKDLTSAQQEAFRKIISDALTALEQSVREDEQQKTLAILKKINEGSKKVSLEISRLKEEVAALTLAAKIPRGE